MNQSGFHFCFLNFIIFFFESKNSQQNIQIKQSNEIIIKKLKKYNWKGYKITIAGNGTQGTNDGQGALAQFFGPYCVTMDSIGNIYVGDLCAIRMINSTGFFGEID